MLVNRQHTLARLAHLVDAPPDSAQVKRFYNEWNALWSAVHQLAELQDGDLLPLLRRALRHPDPFIREGALELAGFHYDLTDDAELLGHLRLMLHSDASEDVRLAAASVLGVQANAWDEALVWALTNDPDEDVRRAAFAGLLRLLRLGPGPEERWLREVEAGRLGLTLDALRAIAARYDL
ncbi:HEAT repeat domain-containing protein [Deinococcus planocerae]|uniref:HEAT repeat domain-containing protein n=1 Tax=Deinococcus planocerae TaxID=1737569 RepID=UPI000C7F3043|nr:HEAT repeat domain-containing protein [Deinococcus planocerae]